VVCSGGYDDEGGAGDGAQALEGRMMRAARQESTTPKQRSAIAKAAAAARWGKKK
jgi:hypothetical protein